MLACFELPSPRNLPQSHFQRFTNTNVFVAELEAHRSHRQPPKINSGMAGRGGEIKKKAFQLKDLKAETMVREEGEGREMRFEHGRLIFCGFSSFSMPMEKFSFSGSPWNTNSNELRGLEVSKKGI